MTDTDRPQRITIHNIGPHPPLGIEVLKNPMSTAAELNIGSLLALKLGLGRCKGLEHKTRG